MPRSWRNLFIIIGLCVAIGGITMITNHATKNLSPAKPVDNFSYYLLTGQQSQLYDHHGKQIVLHFWATWCVPCQAELPVLINIAARQQNTIFLLVSVDDDADMVKQFIAPHKISDNIELILDSERKIAAQMHISAFPENFVINPDMTLRQRLVGAVSWQNYPF